MLWCLEESHLFLFPAVLEIGAEVVKHHQGFASSVQ